MCGQKMVRPARRRAVPYIQQACGLSERSACRALGASRATQRYDSRRPAAEELTGRPREFAIQRPRFGYRRPYLLLRRESNVVNDKRVYPVYRSEGLTLRIKRRKRLAATSRAAPPVPNAPGKTLVDG